MSTQTVLGATRTVGTAALRVEDLRILTGKGRYVDDLKLAGMLHATFLRSPLAHARITGIDITAALQAEGVVAIYTGQDFKDRTQGIQPIQFPAGIKTEPVFGLT